MKYLGLIFLPLALASWILIAKIAHYAGMPGFPVLQLYSQASSITKLMTTTLLLGLAATIVLGVIRMAGMKGVDRGLFIGLLWGGVGAGLLTSAYSFLVINMIIERTHTTNMRVAAPSAAEALLPISVGMTIAAVCGLVIAFTADKPARR
jgi:hypothetical protein